MEAINKPAIAKSLLDKFVKAGADDVVIDMNEDHSRQIKFANSRISITQNWNTAKADIFIALGKNS